MGNTIITLTDQQISRLEQIIIDRDIDGAFSLLKEIQGKTRFSKSVCDPVEHLMRESVNKIIDPSKR